MNPLHNPHLAALELHGRVEDTTPEMNHYLGAQEMKRTAEIMQEAARDFLNAATSLKESCDVLIKIDEHLTETLRDIERTLAANRPERRGEVHRSRSPQAVQLLHEAPGGCADETTFLGTVTLDPTPPKVGVPSRDDDPVPAE